MNNVEAHIEALLQLLHGAQSEECLLWIDPAQQDVFAGHPLVEARRVRVPIQHANFDPTLAHYLVPINVAKYEDAELFSQSVHFAWQAWQMPSLLARNGQPVCGWVMSDAPAPELAAHWGQRCSLHWVDTQRLRLRFHDPSVREWLWPILSPTQRLQLLGPAQGLLSLGRQLQIVEHTQDANAPIPNEIEALAISDAQWSQINDYATLHGAWLDYCELDEKHRLTLEGAPSHWVANTLSALQQASYFGIADPQDRRLFALHALQFGSTFYLNPKLQSAWAHTQRGDFYSEALEAAMQQPVDQLAGFLEKGKNNVEEK